ncbi:hypothetical protein MKW92_047684 [Papaver armeniacum]|nr:hypothetical protein MKW92_047684 [Papaver armeniacum]
MSNRNGTTSSADGGSSNGGEYHQHYTKHTSIQVVDKKRETHHTFKVRYYNDKIRTTVTHTASVVDQWIADVYKNFADKINDDLVVGLDIEWVRNNKVDVLQLCFAHRCLIFQFFGCDEKEVPKSLVNFLNDERIIFVGAGMDEAAHKLLVDYGLSIARTQDLGRLADYKLGTRGLYQVDLNSLMNIVLDEHLHHQPKFGRITFSRWDRDTLKNEQVEYACLDAYASFKLGLYLLPLPASKNFKKFPQETNQR